MLHEEVSKLESVIAEMQVRLNDYKYAEANYELNLVTMKAERDVMRANRDSEQWQKWAMEKHVKSLIQETEFLRKLILEKYGHRTSNEPSDEITEPAPF